MTRRDRLAACLRQASAEAPYEGWPDPWQYIAHAALAWMDRNRDEAAPRDARAGLLTALWAQHDALERQILLLERTFTDAELTALGAAAAPPDTAEPMAEGQQAEET